MYERGEISPCCVHVKFARWLPSCFLVHRANRIVMPRSVGAAPFTMNQDFLRQETEAKTVSGWIALLMASALLVFGGFFLYGALARMTSPQFFGGLGVIGTGLLCMRGFFTLQPNEAAVMMFLGSYAGSARNSGFHWVNPFYVKRRLSLRAQSHYTHSQGQRRARQPDRDRRSRRVARARHGPRRV